jgi:hypothetical protein
MDKRYMLFVIFAIIIVLAILTLRRPPADSDVQGRIQEIQELYQQRLSGGHDLTEVDSLIQQARSEYSKGNLGDASRLAEEAYSLLISLEGFCGDGTCGDGEDCKSCWEDCGKCAYCPNGVCDDGETTEDCPEDCQTEIICGDGYCDPAETTDNCPEDCSQAEAKPRFAVQPATPREDVIEIISRLGDGLSGVNDFCYNEDSQTRQQNLDLLDRTYSLYTSYGRDLQLNVLSCSDVAASRTNTKLPQDISDYKSWLTSVVNKYDIPYYQIDSEPSPTSFEGSKEDFVELLDISYEVIKTADPDAEVMCCGFGIGDAFVDLPEGPIEDVVDARLETKPRFKEDFEFMEYVLENGKFDILTIHLAAGHESIEDTLEWFRQYSDKPIMFDDMISVPYTGGYFTPSDTDLSAKYSIMDDPSDPLYEQTTAEIEAEQAILTVKKCVEAFSLGVERVFLLRDIDMYGDYPIPLFRHSGLIHTQEQRIKPVFYTYKLMIGFLDGFTVSEKLEEGITSFSFADKSPVFVLWGNGNVDLSTYVNGQVRVTHIITKGGKTDEDALVEIVDGSSIGLTENPVFVESI